MHTPTQEDLVDALCAQGIRDIRIIQAFREVPRARFVPPHLREQAYLDQPLSIPHGQVTTQPSLVARMVEALGLRESDTVLEIGTGYGFQTAVLAHLCRFVWSMERWPGVAATARANLAAQAVTNVEIIVGDGTEGRAEHAPFDAIIISAAFPAVPPPLADQLADQGRLVQPIGSGGREEVILFEKTPEGIVPRRVVSQAHFVRLYGRHAFPAESNR